MHHSFPLNCLCINFLSEPLSLKMHIGSAKPYDFFMFVCFAFMYDLLSCLQTCMLSSDMKRANRQNIQKQNSSSNVQKMA